MLHDVFGLLLRLGMIYVSMSWLDKEWHVLTSAPVTFGIAMTGSAGLVWAFTQAWRKRAEGIMQSQNDYLRSQRRFIERLTEDNDRLRKDRDRLLNRIEELRKQ